MGILRSMKNIFLLFLFFTFLGYSQKNEFIHFKAKPEYDTLFIQASNLIQTKKIENYIKAVNEINHLEAEVISDKNNNNIVVYYYNQAIIFYYQKDILRANEILDKAISFSKQNKIYQYLGKIYELKSLSNVGGMQDKYLFLSKEYFEKYAPEKDRKDLYFNLSNYYYQHKDYKKVLKYAVKCREINRKYYHSMDIRLLDIILMYSYIYTDEVEKAKLILKDFDQRGFVQEIKENKFNLVNSHLHKIKALIAIKENNENVAIANLILSDSFKNVETNSRIRKINQDYNFENERNKLNYQLSLAKSQLQLHEKEIKHQNNTRIFLLVILTFLILVIGILVKFSIYKNKINKTLKDKNEQLTDALSIKNKLFDSISHELRTPLNLIKGSIYLFKNNQDASEESKKENIDIIENATNQLVTLTKNIIDYTDIENNKIILSESTFNIKESIEKIVDYYEKLRPNNNSVSINIDDLPSLSIRADKHRVEQVLHCIIDNALKFTSNGTINIHVHSSPINQTKSKIKILVEDSGIGISKENLSTIFDLFNQGSNKIYLEYGGSGLGLDLARKNLDLLKGSIAIDSEEEKGTKVKIEFEIDNIENGLTTADQDVIDNTTCEEKLVLVVEDNKVNQIITKKILISKGYDCEIAENGLQAVEMVKDKDYCLILMDIMMPVMDGFEASKKIKEVKPTAPIVALTAISENLNKEKFDQAKITKIINKPINVSELQETLLAYCN